MPNDFHVKESEGFQRKMTKAFIGHLYDMMVISDVRGKDWKARCDGAYLSSQHLRTHCKKIAQVRDQPELDCLKNKLTHSNNHTKWKQTNKKHYHVMAVLRAKENPI